MTSNLANQQMVIILRNGIEIWLDKAKADAIGEDLEQDRISKFFMAEGRRLNSVEIVGIFFPADLESLKRRKKGDWQCNYGTWHSKDDACQCAQENAREETKVKMEQYSLGLTDEQREKAQKQIALLREQLADKINLKKGEHDSTTSGP